ncbi:MAG: bifunctional methylenetetrahydrofolate dehydrogenase/methenyltetrahydrofolate cyclohydrolase FolD [Candidatus Margulisbacteria bacterium]|nr:bifunctional methylenetetrahydrofolate dehydrogenase/methenyltetrahydrofolate cyclohydrolase FolD [Candidatus Margulisiibacteriota bacterium]
MILDGQVVSQSIQTRLQSEISELTERAGRAPGLAVILVGENPASQAYVGMKKKACERVGVASFEFRVDADYGEDKLIALIENLNSREDIDGILLQLPLPLGYGYDEDKMLQLIDPSKDVDGFHPSNVGKLFLGLPTFWPCTPYGVIELLKCYQIPVEGRHVVIVGRSHIVGKPLAGLFLQKASWANATVTVCHSKSQNLSEITKQADILIAAIGQPGFVTADMVRPGAVVVDVGINRVVDVEASRGYRLVGDVNYEAVAPLASAITPVPGGVGPMTIAMLLSNTVLSFKRRHSYEF